MKKFITIPRTWLTFAKKAPEAPKAEAKAAVEALKVEGTSVGLDLTKSTVKMDWNKAKKTNTQRNR